MDQGGKNLLGKGAFDSSGKEKIPAFTYSAMKMGILPPPFVYYISITAF